MTDHEREIHDEVPASDGTHARITYAALEVPAVEAAGTVQVSWVEWEYPQADVGADAPASRTPRTTAGIEIDYARELRFSHGYKDGMRYVEVVDGNGNYITSTMGTDADAICDLMLYLLPSDHPDYPRD